MDICQIPTKGHVSRQSQEQSRSRATAIELTSDLAAPAIEFHASLEAHVHLSVFCAIVITSIDQTHKTESMHEMFYLMDPIQNQYPVKSVRIVGWDNFVLQIFRVLLLLERLFRPSLSR